MQGGRLFFLSFRLQLCRESLSLVFQHRQAFCSTVGEAAWLVLPVYFQDVVLLKLGKNDIKLKCRNSVIIQSFG